MVSEDAEDGEDNAQDEGMHHISTFGEESPGKIVGLSHAALVDS